MGGVSEPGTSHPSEKTQEQVNSSTKAPKISPLPKTPNTTGEEQLILTQN